MNAHHRSTSPLVLLALAPAFLLTACGRDAGRRSDTAAATQPGAASATTGGGDTGHASPATVATAGAAGAKRDSVRAPVLPPAVTAPGVALPNASLPPTIAAPTRGADSAHASAVTAAPAPALTVSPAPVPVAPAPAAAPVPAVPFHVGEQLTYDVRFGPLKVGTATLSVVGIDTVRGQPAYHTTFRVKGGNLLYKVNDSYESWFAVASLASLRYVQNIDEGHYEKERHFEIFPERSAYIESGKPEQASVAQPLDDGSFVYFLRTLTLDAGQTYDFNRYFRPDRNPVRVQVLRRESVKVPAGTFDAVVIRPIIKTTGIFSENGRAEVWLATDSTRAMLQLQSKLSFGSLNLYLRDVKKGQP